MKLTPTLGIISIAALAFTACATDEPQSREEAQQQYADELESQGIDPMENTDDFNPMDGMGVMETGEFETYSSGDGHIVFELPASPDSEELTEIEQYREDVNADPANKGSTYPTRATTYPTSTHA